MTKQQQEQQVQKELDEWQSSRPDLFDEEDAWVQDVSFDADSLTITMGVDYDFSFTYPTVSILLPDNYYNQSSSAKKQNGDDKNNFSFSVSYGDSFQEFNKCNSLRDALNQLFSHFEHLRNEAIDAMSPMGDGAMDFGVDDDEEGLTTEEVTTPATGISEVEEEIFVVEDDKVNPAELIERDLEELRSMDGFRGMYRGSGVDEIRVYLFFDPRKKLDISDMVAAAWGIDMNKYIGIALTFSSHYLDADTIPQIDAFQSGNTSPDAPDSLILDGRVQFGLYWTVQERLRSHFFKQYWPFPKYEQVQAVTGKSYMLAVIEEAMNIIKNSPQLCIICGKPLPYEGLKPTVCDSQLCVFSHEEYGLGVDLESAIIKSPELVDLAMTMTFAASVADSSRYNPFNPFPSGLEVKLVNREKGTVDTFNFLNAKGEPDNSKVRAVLDKVPNLETLVAWVKEGKLKDRCDALDPLLYSLLRWMLASNRSHLKKLKPFEQISAMNTPHQYVLMSSPPAREKLFQELKKQYGSVYAFHGSALGNWHSIMRQGLKNMSGTAGQVNGAVYGSGVYLAPESVTSFSYMRYLPGWKHSMFKSSTLGCMAICEIIKHPSLKGQPNPYYVVADESLIATRYFLLFASQTSAAVDGATLKPPPLKWS